MHDIIWHFITWYHTTRHYTTLHYITLHYNALHCITSHHTTSHDTACVTWHDLTYIMPCITLHHITLHVITLQYLSLSHLIWHLRTHVHYITLHYTHALRQLIRTCVGFRRGSNTHQLNKQNNNYSKYNALQTHVRISSGLRQAKKTKQQKQTNRKAMIINK